jgi:hypothetical protein
VLPARQAPAEQQPVGHDVPSQTQVLATHRWPGEHAVPVPHRQAPVAEQLSERASQATQVDPALPQAVTERLAQTVPAQQPLGHEVVSQTHRPLSQRCPPAQEGPVPHVQAPAALQRSALLASHVMQPPPLTPQLDSDVTLQTFPAQQPPAHEVASHTQAPARQRCPA